jgi:transposase
MARWPKSDQRAAGITDLRILTARGMTLDQAADQLGIHRATAYRWIGGQHA